MSLPNTIEFEIEIKTELKDLEVDLKTEVFFTTNLKTSLIEETELTTELKNLMVQI